MSSSTHFQRQRFSVATIYVVLFSQQGNGALTVPLPQTEAAPCTRLAWPLRSMASFQATPDPKFINIFNIASYSCGKGGEQTYLIILKAVSLTYVVFFSASVHFS